MSIDIPSELEPFVQDVIRRGVYQSADEVVVEALKVLRDIERRRSELRADIRAGLASEGLPAEMVFMELDRLAAQLAKEGE